MLVYNLTGWIAENIFLRDVTHVDGILERLYSNFNDGNTIITFTLKNHSTPTNHSPFANHSCRSYMALTNINL